MINRNAKTPNVQGNAIKKITEDDISRGDLGVLAVENPEDFQTRTLGYIQPTSLQLRLNLRSSLKDIINNESHPNNYIVNIPVDKNDLQYYNKDKELVISEQDLNIILGYLPNLELIKADYLYNSDQLGNNCWTVSWEFDGVFGTQIAKYKGLVFSRTSSYRGNKATWTQWDFHDNQHLIGTTRFDFTNIGVDENFMGWINLSNGGNSIDIKTYPKLCEFIKRAYSGDSNDNDVNLNGKVFYERDGKLTITNPSGFYPRITGSVYNNIGFSNPDYANAKCSDNIDYANKNAQTRVSWNFGVYVYNVTWTDKRFSELGTGAYAKRDLGIHKSNISMDGHYSIIWGSNGSNNETRPKTKFFNFLIYAGYPQDAGNPA